ncbi:MAG: hypothetical protein IT536_08775 [Hyphomicrobiales bacterium]|nr:hypothetical protein [Hyphomicrobiales bacterium]
MDRRAQSPLCEDVKAAFDWWRDAGVDCDFHDQPASWLEVAPAAREGKDAPSPPPAMERGPRDPLPAATVQPRALPRDLAGFVEWWLAAPELDDGRTTARIAPRGEKGAALMVLVSEPEREDRDFLLSGPQGKLLANLLRAMGFEERQIYFASVLPRHLPGADWEGLMAAGLGEVMLHHISLVVPERLICFGGNILPLFGNDWPQGAAVLRQINLEGHSIPMLATRSLQTLLDRPQWKDELWKAWLGWTGTAATVRGTTG